jgi:iron-sulfur cluster assembly accessory protein
MVMVSQHKADDPAAGLGDQISAEGPIAAAEAAAAPAPVEEQLSITDSCWKRIRQLAQRRNLSLQDVYLRVYVDAGGCSGFSYKFEIDEAPVEEGEDVVFRHPNIPDLRVVVDAASLDLIRGSSIDYVEEMIKSSFEVRDNPQSESACGCGSSFALKNFAANPALD